MSALSQSSSPRAHRQHSLCMLISTVMIMKQISKERILWEKEMKEAQEGWHIARFSCFFLVDSQLLVYHTHSHLLYLLLYQCYHHLHHLTCWPTWPPVAYYINTVWKICPSSVSASLPLYPFFCWKLRILLSSVNDSLLPSFSAGPFSDCLPRLSAGLLKWLSFTWCSTNSKRNIQKASKKLNFLTLHRHGTPCEDLITVRTAISKSHLEYESILFLYVLQRNL